MEAKCLFFLLFVCFASLVSALPTEDFNNHSTTAKNEIETENGEEYEAPIFNHHHRISTTPSTSDDDVTTELAIDTEKSTERNYNYTENLINEVISKNEIKTENSKESESEMFNNDHVNIQQSTEQIIEESHTEKINEVRVESELKTQNGNEYEVPITQIFNHHRHRTSTTPSTSDDYLTTELTKENTDRNDDYNDHLISEVTEENEIKTENATEYETRIFNHHHRTTTSTSDDDLSTELRFFFEENADRNVEESSGDDEIEIDYSTTPSTSNDDLTTELSFYNEENTDDSKSQENEAVDTKDLILEAISKDDANKTKALIERFNGNFNGSDDFIWLGQASEKCKLNVAKMLIENGVSVEIHKPSDKWHPLHIAAYNGCDEVAKLLIENGADLDIENGLGYTSLHMAITRDKNEIAKLLIENGAEVSHGDSWYLEYVTPRQVTDYLEYAETESTETESTTENDVNQKVDESNDQNGTDSIKNMILEAISNDDGNQTETLIEDLIAGYLKVAAEKCKPNVAKTLIQNGVNSNVSYGESKWRPLHVATYSDCEEVAKILIESGVDINVKTETGFTALHLAARYGGAKIAELLIQNGADIELKDSDPSSGLTAIEWANLRNHDDVVKVLTENGAKIPKTDSDSDSNSNDENAV